LFIPVENGPTLFFMTITMMLMFGSAFFTDIIGVHAIFGMFDLLSLYGFAGAVVLLSLILTDVPVC